MNRKQKVITIFLLSVLLIGLFCVSASALSLRDSYDQTTSGYNGYHTLNAPGAAGGIYLTTSAANKAFNAYRDSVYNKFLVMLNGTSVVKNWTFNVSYQQQTNTFRFSYSMGLVSSPEYDIYFWLHSMTPAQLSKMHIYTFSSTAEYMSEVSYQVFDASERYNYPQGTVKLSEGSQLSHYDVDLQTYPGFGLNNTENSNQYCVYFNVSNLDVDYFYIEFKGIYDAQFEDVYSSSFFTNFSDIFTAVPTFVVQTFSFIIEHLVFLSVSLLLVCGYCFVCIIMKWAG